MTKFLISSFSALLISITAIGFPSSARALSKDEMFTFLLSTKDYYYGSDRDSVSLAKDICGQVRKAKSTRSKVRASETIGTALRLTGWSFDKSNQFISTAVEVYCPGQGTYVYEGWINGYYP